MMPTFPPLSQNSVRRVFSVRLKGRNIRRGLPVDREFSWAHPIREVAFTPSSGGMPNNAGERRGEGKPEPFDFLGFTHISGKG
jgi:hypothetical protein